MAGIILITLATFFHSEVAGLFQLSLADESRLISLGLFWGGVAGGAGVLISIVGFLRRSGTEKNVHLAPTVIIMIGMAILFFLLLFSFIKTYEPQNMRSDETITI
ncbi:MAG TPA: hypothetical protein VFG19_09300 [Geobacteraceae bacterium]|nr:hypothetical protein [Geobacteraceae bacterium]